MQPLRVRVPNFDGGFWRADGTQLIGYTTLYTIRTADNRYHGSLKDQNKLQGKADQQSEVKITRYAPDRQRSHLFQVRLTSNLPHPEGFTTLPDGKNLLAILNGAQHLASGQSSSITVSFKKWLKFQSRSGKRNSSIIMLPCRPLMLKQPIGTFARPLTIQRSGSNFRSTYSSRVMRMRLLLLLLNKPGQM
jgi:hypothetical protein